MTPECIHERTKFLDEEWPTGEAIPTCDHGGKPVPCTVLDPFGGAGTVGLVADKLGRNAILIELNPEYAEMARRRIYEDCPMFTDVRTIETPARGGGPPTSPRPRDHHPGAVSEDP